MSDDIRRDERSFCWIKSGVINKRGCCGKYTAKKENETSASLCRAEDEEKPHTMRNNERNI